MYRLGLDNWSLVNSISLGNWSFHLREHFKIAIKYSTYLYTGHEMGN